MNKILILISIISIILIIFGFVRILISYSSKAKKYGKTTTGTIIGYDYSIDRIAGEDSFSITFYPVVSFIDDTSIEQIAISKLYFNFPIYKIGEKIKIDYYNTNNSNYITKKISTSLFSKKYEEISINKSIIINILGTKKYLDIVIWIIILIITIIISSLKYH